MPCLSLRSLWVLLLIGWGVSPAAGQPQALTDEQLSAMPDDTAKLTALILTADRNTDRNPERSRRLLQQAHALNNELSSEPHGVRITFQEGYLAYSLGDYPLALRHYLRAYDQYKALGQPQRMAFTLLRIGQMLERQRDYTKAEAYLRRALALSEKHRLHKVKIDVYSELGNLADIRGNPRQAVAYGELVAKNLLAARDTNNYYYTLINLGIHYKNLKQYDKAVATFADIRRYAKARRDDYLLVYADLNLPHTLIAQSRLNDAEAIVAEGAVLAGRMPESQHLRTEVNQIRYQISKRRGDYRQALMHHEQWATLRDSVLNAERARQVTEIETRHATKEKEAQIAELDGRNVRDRRQKAMLGGGLALTLALLGGLAWFYRRLQRQKRLTERQANQLALMMRELHHRVKNNLATVSSLLNLQSARLGSDENAQRIFREGQQRVEAMALIHQRLYQSNQVTTVNMADYVADLIQGLMYAYGYTRDQLALNVVVEHPELDVDRAIPLGLILNELLTNAFKYAFPAVSRPALWVRLWADGGALVLDVRDNGPGLDAGVWQRLSGSFGKQLIRSLSQQLGGHLSVDGQDGLHVVLRVPPATTLPANQPAPTRSAVTT